MSASWGRAFQCDQSVRGLMGSPVSVVKTHPPSCQALPACACSSCWRSAPKHDPRQMSAFEDALIPEPFGGDRRVESSETGDSSDGLWV